MVILTRLRVTQRMKFCVTIEIKSYQYLISCGAIMVLTFNSVYEAHGMIPRKRKLQYHKVKLSITYTVKGVCHFENLDKT